MFKAGILSVLSMRPGKPSLKKSNYQTAITLEFGGQFENQQRAAARLSLVIPISLGLIFLLLFSTFGSVSQAVLVLSNIPLAMIGGVFALGFSGEYLSVPASVGFIALLGIAVLNGVVMVSYFNQLRESGMELSRVVVYRFRPALTAGINDGQYRCFRFDSVTVCLRPRFGNSAPAGNCSDRRIAFVYAFNPNSFADFV